MSNTRVSKNIVDGEYTVGGGIYNSFSTVELIDSTISGNITRLWSLGGGIYSEGGTLSIIGSTVSGNSTHWDGGGLYNSSTDLTVVNSTFSGNSNVEGGGDIYNFATATLTNTTISQNSASIFGGGFYNFGGALRLRNTIIAGNEAPTGPDCYDDVPSSGYNLIGDTADCGFVAAPGDLVNVDPMLGPFRRDGGPTRTHALLDGSPAIDAIPVARCNDADGNPVTTDQRGLPRPQGSACDIGAYELRQH